MALLRTPVLGLVVHCRYIRSVIFEMERVPFVAHMFTVTLWSSHGPLLDSSLARDELGALVPASYS